MPQGTRTPAARTGLLAVGLVVGAAVGCTHTDRKPVPPARQVGPPPAASGPNTVIPTGAAAVSPPPARQVGVTPAGGTSPAPGQPTSANYPGQPNALDSVPNRNNYGMIHGQPIPNNQAVFSQSPARPMGMVPPAQPPAAVPGNLTNMNAPALPTPKQIETAAASMPVPPPMPVSARASAPVGDLASMDLPQSRAETMPKMGAAGVPAFVKDFPMAPQPPDGVAPRVLPPTPVVPPVAPEAVPPVPAGKPAFGGGVGLFGGPN